MGLGKIHPTHNHSPPILHVCGDTVLAGACESFYLPALVK